MRRPADRGDGAAPQPGLVADQLALIRLAQQAHAIRLPVAGVRSALTGLQASRFRGRGMDYSESRRYQPGDDVRRIDWRVTARTNKTHTKIYTEEKERPVFILADYSASLFFGTRKNLKSVTLAEVGALLTWAAVTQGERVGGVITGRHGVQLLKPRAGRTGALSIIHALSAASRQLPTGSLDPQPTSCLATGLEQSSRIIHPGSLVILLSDFYALDDRCEKHLRQLRAHNDLIAGEIIDPLEQRAPGPGRYALTDGRQTTLIDIRDAASRQRYLQQFTRKQQRLQRLTRQLSIAAFSVLNGTDTAAAVQRVFAVGRHTGRRRVQRPAMRAGT